MNTNSSQFSRKHRLLKKEEFDFLFDRSKQITDPHLKVLYKKTEQSYPRLGLIVGKRTVNSAVLRNRIKRVVRESFRMQKNAFAHHDIIVIARKRSDQLTKLKLREEIENLWKKVTLKIQTKK